MEMNKILGSKYSQYLGGFADQEPGVSRGRSYLSICENFEVLQIEMSKEQCQKMR